MTTEPVNAAGLGMALGFLKLVVDDLEAMATFYSEAFGFAVRDRIDMPEIEEVMLVQPGQTFNLVLLRWKDGRALTIGNAHGPIGMTTRSVDQTFAHARASGATVEREPYDLGPMRIAFVLDPEGHEIELIEFKAAAKPVRITS
jgi:lactoylglutathione lyase